MKNRSLFAIAFGAVAIAIGAGHSNGAARGAQGRGEAQGPPPVDPAVAARMSPIAYEHVIKMETDLSNWGRWGKDDERGSLNFVTARKTMQAVKLVRDGV